MSDNKPAPLKRIDRIDTNGFIREHLVSPDDEKRTLCGLELWNTQSACGNRGCKRCDAIAAKLGLVVAPKVER